ncbi:MAG: hypothetical protein ACLS3M_10185 [Collinsella sp.]
MRKAALRLARPSGVNCHQDVDAGIEALKRRYRQVFCCLSSLRRLKMSIVPLRVAKTSKSQLGGTKTLRPRSSDPAIFATEKDEHIQSLRAMAWSSKSSGSQR